MKNDYLRRISLAFLMTLVCVTVSYAFKVDGLNYSITSESDYEVEVIAAEEYNSTVDWEIEIPEVVTWNDNDYRVTSIGRSAFLSCSHLTSINLPEGLTGLGDYAFFYCTSLTDVTIPSSVTSIGEYAFSECESLTDIYSQNETPPTCYDSDVFSSSTYSDATLHVPSEALSDYKTASTWKEFYTIVGDVVTGVEDIAITQDYSIRASDGVITVSGVSGTVYVYSINGKKVAEATADGGTTGIRISHHGVYIVKIYDGKSSATQKVII